MLSAHTYSYGYDGNSNRTAITADTITTTNTFNAVNEWTQAITTAGTANYFWDAAGNELGNDGRGVPSQAQTITYNAKNQLSSITDDASPENTIPMTYTGPGEAERVSANWVSSNSHTPWGNNTYTYGSGMLSQTNSAGIDQPGTIHYTLDPYGTPIAQRVPGASTNYYYLLSADRSVIRLIDKSGNVLATYDYCPTGNPPGDIMLTAAALNNPIGYLGEYQDTGTKMLYSATFTDNNSGIITHICLFPVLGGLFPGCGAVASPPPLGPPLEKKQTTLEAFFQCLNCCSFITDAGARASCQSECVRCSTFCAVRHAPCFPPAQSPCWIDPLEVGPLS